MKLKIQGSRIDVCTPVCCFELWLGRCSYSRGGVHTLGVHTGSEVFIRGVHTVLTYNYNAVYCTYREVYILVSFYNKGRVFRLHLHSKCYSHKT